MAGAKYVVMIGTHFNTMGGISSVVNVYRSTGLFDRFKIKYLTTHCDGKGSKKAKIFVFALVKYLFLLLMGRIALLHVHVASRASFWRKCFFLLPAFAFGVPNIVHLHGAEFADFYEEECGAVRKRLVKYVFNSATKIIVLSSAWHDWVCGMCQNPRVQAVYNPVIIPPQQSPWAKRSASKVLFLGRLGKRKGTYDLLKASAQVQGSGCEFQLLLGGDGKPKEVRDYATALGIKDKVKLLGWVQGLKKEQYLSEAKIYVLPSYKEGLPMSVLEAMAAGLPVISSPVGGIPDAISDGIEGFLVPPGNIEMLACRMKQLLNDDRLAMQMGTAARHKVLTKFAADIVVPQIERIYNELGILAE
jgi:glycosyltransferase involved in cell wall biosynthesis